MKQREKYIDSVARAIFETTKTTINKGVGWDCMSDRTNLSEEMKNMYRDMAKAAIEAI